MSYRFIDEIYNYNEQLTPILRSTFKQRAVKYYHSIVINLFRIPWGWWHQSVERWHDGTISSLGHRHRSGRSLILYQKEIDQRITNVVRSHNRDYLPLHYTEIIDFVLQETDADVSFRTVQRYGEKSGIVYKKPV